MRHLNDRLIKYSQITYLHVRTYVAATYAKIDKIPSRIRHKQDTIHLQALTSYKLGHKLSGEMNLREYFLGSTWHTLLKIDNKKQGIFYEETYLDLTSGQDKTSFTSPENIVFTENIFGVPQTLWESFIAHLDQQKVVDLLNLKKHRHLWPAYHYALSAPTTQLATARAQLIGQFHFLLSIALYPSEDIEQHQPDMNKDFHLPVLKTIKHELDRGEFSKKNMAKLHHCLTVLVVNKLRHCTNILDLNLLAMMISNYSKMALELPDTPRKLSAINMLPSSDTEPHRFASALKLAKIVEKMSARPGLLFFNSQSQWGTNANKEDNRDKLGKHYFDALFHDLIQRQVILQAHTSNTFVDNDLLHVIKEHFESFFLQETAMNKIESLQTYWQHNSHMIAAIKPVQHQERFWSPLISNTKINGITIHSLASVDSVIQHGKLMRHCVQGDVFVECCRSMQANILELVSEDGEISTLDIRPNYGGGYYTLQHVGVGGHQPPSKPHLEAGIKLLEEIRTGRINLSKARQMQYLDSKSKPTYHVDYELDDLATQEKIYQVYKSKKMLPPRLIYANHTEMLAATKLVTIIDDVFKKMSGAEELSSQPLPRP